VRRLGNGRRTHEVAFPGRAGFGSQKIEAMLDNDGLCLASVSQLSLSTSPGGMSE
jgi:hypothetical protein